MCCINLVGPNNHHLVPLVFLSNASTFSDFLVLSFLSNKKGKQGTESEEEKGNTTQHQNSVISQFPSKTKIPQLILNLQLLSLFHSVAAHARSYEPDCTRYLIYSYPSTSPLRLVSGGLEIQSTRLKGSKIAIIERYNTQKAFEEHTQSDAFGKLAKALGEESLLAESVGGMEESWVQKIGGFE